MSKIKQTIAERVRWLRKNRGLSMQALADKSGLSKGHINNIERQIQSDVRASTLQTLSTALDVSVSELIGEENVNAIPRSERGKPR